MQVTRAIFASIIFSSTGSGGHLLFTKIHRSRARLSLNYRYKPPSRHLESGDDPGDGYNLAPRVLSLSLGKLILNLATKVPTIEIFPKENPNLASVTRTIAGAANMKNALNFCTYTSCQVLHHSNHGYPECDEFFSLFHIFVVWRNFCVFKSPRIRKK